MENLAPHVEEGPLGFRARQTLGVNEFGTIQGLWRSDQETAERDLEDMKASVFRVHPQRRDARGRWASGYEP